MKIWVIMCESYYPDFYYDYPGDPPEIEYDNVVGLASSKERAKEMMMTHAKSLDLKSELTIESESDEYIRSSDNYPRDGDDYGRYVITAKLWEVDAEVKES